MNRRNFIGQLLSATAGFTILPSAGRLWKPTIQPVTLIAYPETVVELNKLGGKWSWVEGEDLNRLGLRGYQAEYEMSWEGKRL